jgi:VWFA-related protein
VAAILAATAAAQETPVFRAESNLVLVRFHVVKKQRYVTALTRDDVVLLEDGAPRAFTLFEGGNAAAARTLPVDFTLLFDTSGSVRNAGLLNPLVFKESVLDGLEQVRIAVYGFGDRLHRFCAPTRDFAVLKSALAALERKRPPEETIALRLPPRRRVLDGSTWLFESVIAGAGRAAAVPANGTRMLVVFSDGLGNTTSTAEDAAGVCRDLGIPVYPVVLGHAQLVEEARLAVQQAAAGRSEAARQNYRLKQLQNQETRMEEFAQLGSLTGGRSFSPPEITLNVMRQILAGMVAQVRTEYVVGFVPEPDAGAARSRKLEIRLRSKDAGSVLGGTRTVLR